MNDDKEILLEVLQNRMADLTIEKMSLEKECYDHMKTSFIFYNIPYFLISFMFGYSLFRAGYGLFNNNLDNSVVFSLLAAFGSNKIVSHMVNNRNLEMDEIKNELDYNEFEFNMCSSLLEQIKKDDFSKFDNKLDFFNEELKEDITNSKEFSDLVDAEINDYISSLIEENKEEKVKKYNKSR